MKAISIKQPWAWLIVQGYKPVENRTWRTKHRGTILIHAGKHLDTEGVKWVNDHFPEIILPTFAQGINMGGIVGYAMLTGCVSSCDSPWFSGPNGFIMECASPLPFFGMSGKLGLFDVPAEYQQKLRRDLHEAE